MNLPLLAIIGPTAVGKTNLFLRLVNHGFPLEAIIADSRQVYRYMDIGTGKDLPTEPRLKKLFHLYDVVTPDQAFSSANFFSLAHQSIRSICQRNHLPALVGGTNRYIKDLENQPATLLIPPNTELRQQLSTLNLSQLQQHLRQINPQKLSAMNQSDVSNPRRLIRAIEVASSEVTNFHSPPISINKIGLTAPLQLIEAKIAQRIQTRMEQGMEQEVAELLSRYSDFLSYQASHTPGYQEIAQYLNQQISLDQAKRTWLSRELAYAKRQLTWFRHQEPHAVWFDITDHDWYIKLITALERMGYVSSYPQN